MSAANRAPHPTEAAAARANTGVMSLCLRFPLTSAALWAVLMTACTAAVALH